MQVTVVGHQECSTWDLYQSLFDFTLAPELAVVMQVPVIVTTTRIFGGLLAVLACAGN